MRRYFTAACVRMFSNCLAVLGRFLDERCIGKEEKRKIFLKNSSNGKNGEQRLKDPRKVEKVMFTRGKLKTIQCFNLPFETERKENRD